MFGPTHPDGEPQNRAMLAEVRRSGRAVKPATQRAPATSPYHGRADVIEANGKTEARCICGWRSGYRRRRPIAISALSGHIESMRAMPLSRAQGILNDHAHGLHEAHDRPDGCTHIGCAEAYFVVARDEERRDLVRVTD